MSTPVRPIRPDSPWPEFPAPTILPVVRSDSLSVYRELGVDLDMSSRAKICTIPLVDMGRSPAEASQDFGEALGALGLVAVTNLEGVEEGAKHCLRALALYLGESEESFVDLLKEDFAEDCCMITMIPKVTDPGVALLLIDGTQLPVVVPDGAAVVVAGNILSELTAGAIPSVDGRLTNPSNKSVSFFSRPDLLRHSEV